MNKDTENICRICLLYFCCAKCRFKHEKSFHKITEDCEICIYGWTVLRKLTAEKLEHMKNKHLPLHCVFCRKVFPTVEDLLFAHVCSGQKQDNQETSNDNSQSFTCELGKSVPSNNKMFGSNHVNYLTSTPMYRNDKGVLQMMPDGSPVLRDETGDTKNIEISAPTPDVIAPHTVSQIADTIWESAVADESFTSKQIFECTDVTHSIKSSSSTGIHYYKQQLSLEDVAEESSEFNDENKDSNNDQAIFDLQEKETSTHFKSQDNFSMWTTITNVWKSAWKGFSHKDSQERICEEKSIKRSRVEDTSDEEPDVKRHKVQSRNPIHPVPILRYDTNTKKVVICYDKAVQTD